MKSPKYLITFLKSPVSLRETTKTTRIGSLFMSVMKINPKRMRLYTERVYLNCAVDELCLTISPHRDYDLMVDDPHDRMAENSND